jgi:hypothetical protein
MIDEAASPTNVDENGNQLSADKVTDWDARPGLGEPWLKVKGPLHGNMYRKAA